MPDLTLKEAGRFLTLAFIEHSDRFIQMAESFIMAEKARGWRQNQAVAARFGTPARKLRTVMPIFQQRSNALTIASLSSRPQALRPAFAALS